MSGYFSRLIRQTGVSIRDKGHHGEAKPSRPESAERGEARSIDVEDRVTVDASRHRPSTPVADDQKAYAPGELTRKNVEAETSQPDRIVETTETRPTPFSDDGIVLGKPAAGVSRPMDGAMHGEQSAEKATTIHETDTVIVHAEERKTPGRTITPQPLKTDEKAQAVEPDELGTEISLRSGGSIVRSNLEVTHERRLQFNGGQDSIQGRSRLIPQATLREVREWVAKTPAPGSVDTRLGDSIAQPRDESVAAATDHVKYHPFDQIEARHVSPQRPAGMRQEANDLVSDLNLSIGTISVSVEAPQDAITSKRQPPARKESRPKEADSRSRLRRHYIRLR
jgi:hypothetical protein